MQEHGNRNDRAIDVVVLEAHERIGGRIFTHRDRDTPAPVELGAELIQGCGRNYRGHATRDRELGTCGLGLGLAIVADCVDTSKGDIRVESTLGEGTTFFLQLPTTAEI